ncbi:TolC family protein [Marinicaulis aureus]|uniref:TolC family protein n=1 Tax=Hyphococcus aureus TaxID=2666033 RepID=A0ABW1KZQ0_9PROT
MRRLFLFAAYLFAFVSAPANAMPPEPLIAKAVDASPMVMAAKADLDRAHATAKRLRVGEYEVVVSGTGGRRTVDDPAFGESEYTEWNAGLSRTVRLPAKRRADKDLASLEVEKTEAAYENTRKDALLEFVALWTDWRAATEASLTARRLANDAQQLAIAEEKAVKLGASRQIYVNQLSAESALLLLEADRKVTEAENAMANLAAAFPDLVIPASPVALEWDEARIIALMEAEAPESAAVREARLSRDQMETKARRARLDQLADPTFGVQFANEFGGNETSVMATVSIPLGGRARRAAAAEAGSQAVAASARLRASELDAVRRYEQAKRAAKTASKNFNNAEDAVRQARSAMDRLKKGYTIGAVALGDLTAARRTLTLTEQALVEYRITAERAYLTLAVLNDGFAEPANHGQF